MGFLSILDGMTVDAGRNLYVVEMQGNLWRVDPNGVVELAVNLAGAFLPAVNFGPGTGGWDANWLYVGDFLGKAHEVEVGIPAKWEPHMLVMP